MLNLSLVVVSCPNIYILALKTFFCLCVTGGAGALPQRGWFLGSGVEISPMFRSLMSIFVGVALVCVLSSCGKPESGKAPVTDGVKETLDYGGTVGRTYNQSKEKLQKINQEQNRQLEEALEEMP